MKKRFIVVVFLFASWTLFLNIVNLDSPVRDSAKYLCQSLVFYRSLVSGGLYNFAQTFIFGSFAIKPPLVSVLPIPFYFILGESFISAMMVNVFLVAAISVLIFYLTMELSGGDERVSLMSVIIINTFPLVGKHTLAFRTELPLAAIVLLWLLLLMKSDNFNNKAMILPLGVCSGLGLLMKTVFPVYVYGPVLFVLARLILSKDKTKIRSAIPNLIMIIFLGIFIASPWYIFNWHPMVRHVKFHAFSELIAKYYSCGGSNICSELFLYAKRLIEKGVSVYYFLVYCLCCMIALFRKINIFKSRGFILAGILAPMLFILATPNKTPGYILPVFVPAAIYLALVLRDILGKYSFAVLFIPMAVFFLGPFFDLPDRGRLFKKDKINTTFVHPTQEIADFISRQPGSTFRVACLAEEVFSNPLSFNYYATLRYSPYNFSEKMFYHFKGIQEAWDFVREADFIIAKTGYLGGFYLNVYQVQLRQLIMAHPEMFREERKWKTYDGEFLILYKHMR